MPLLRSLVGVVVLVQAHAAMEGDLASHTAAEGAGEAVDSSDSACGGDHRLVLVHQMTYALCLWRG